MGEGNLMPRNWIKHSVSVMKTFGVIKDLELYPEEAGLQCIGTYFKKRNHMIKYSQFNHCSCAM